MGFYRHDQWGVACLADDTRVLTVVFFFGGDHRLGGTVTGTNINKRGQHECKCTSTWLCWPWCEWYCLWHIWFKWSILHLKCKFKLHMLVKLAKLQVSLFVLHKPCDHVCNVPLMYKWARLHCQGSSWISIWIKFDLIPIKPNSKSYWSQFKINSNMVESWIFG